MSIIAGSPEFLKVHGYSAHKEGAHWVIRDEEAGDEEVCRAVTHADAVRKLLAERFDNDT